MTIRVSSLVTAHEIINIKCRREGKDFDKFVEKIKEFSSTYKDNESYRALLNGGTRSLQSVTSRYNYWNNIVENL